MHVFSNFRQAIVRPVSLAVALACGLAALPAQADERSEAERLRATTLQLIKTLVEAGLLSQDKADQLLKQADQPASAAVPATAPTPDLQPKPATAEGRPADAAKAAAPSVIRVPYVPETLRNQMRDEIKQDVLNQAKTERWGEPGAFPAWARRITIEGDVRVRFQSEDWDSRNVAASDEFGLAFQNDLGYEGAVAWAPDLTNTQQRRSRMTLRSRLGLVSDLAFGFKTGLRLSTGSTQAASTSQTLGSTGGFSKYGVLLDRAWIQWTPYAPDITAIAGRFSSPYFGGDLIWPDDVNFDGAAVKANHAFNDANKAYVNVGAFPLQEFHGATDSWLYGAQVGAQFKPDADSQFDLGLAYYDFHGIEGRYDDRYANLMGTSSAVDQAYLSTEYKKAVRQRGNTLMRINPLKSASTGGSAVAPVWGLASKFRPLTLSLAYAYNGWSDLALRGTLDVIQNTAFDLNDIRSRAMPGAPIDVAGKTRAWQGRLQLGSPKQELLGDWQAYLSWRRFERDAWVDAFTDTTWHMGGTNYSGWSLGGVYFVGPRTSAGLRLTSTRNLDDGRTVVDPKTGALVPNLSSIRQRVDVIQLELNARF
jgi:Putative porin